MRTRALFIIVLALLISAAQGSEIAVRLDSVGNVLDAPSGHFAAAGSMLKFYIRYINSSDSGFNVTNGFKITSPDGATWTDSALGGNFHGANSGPIGIDTTGLLSKAQFPTTYTLRSFIDQAGTSNGDGISPDIVEFEGAGNDVGQGVPPHFDGRHLTIRLQSSLADSGRTICIDSAARYRCCAVWKWGVLYGGPMGGFVIPSWSGPHCVRLVNPGNPIATAIPNFPSAMNGSHCDSFDHTFSATDLSGNPITARFYLESGPGSLDSVTGQWTAVGLAPGFYQVGVKARNVANDVWSPVYTFGLTVSDQIPQFTSAGVDIQAAPGVLSTVTMFISNDCDVTTFSLIDSSAVEGPVTCDSVTGELNYTPTLNDAERTTPVAIKVKAADAYAADTFTVNFRFARPYFLTCPGTISGSHCDASITYTYNATAFDGSPLDVRYFLVAGPGAIDSMTGMWSTDTMHIPGNYPVSVNARNVANGMFSSACTATLKVLNQGPHFLHPYLDSLPPYQANLVAGQTGVYKPTPVDDCDEIVCRIEEILPTIPEGPLTFDSTTGEIHYTPTLNDVANLTELVVILSAHDSYGAMVTNPGGPDWVLIYPCQGTTGNVDCSAGDGVDIGDLTALIDNLFISFMPLRCPGEANVNADPEGNIDIGDLTALIDNLFITFTPLPACP